MTKNPMTRPVGDVVSPPSNHNTRHTPKTVYIASSSYNRTGVKLLATLLYQQGIKVTSTWAYTAPHEDADTKKVLNEQYTEGNPHYYVKSRAEIDFADIDRSDIVVMMYPWGSGTASEVGYAIAKGKPVYVLCDVHSLDDLPLPVGLLPSSAICTNFEELNTKINLEVSKC